jgi:hypothetical protein
VGCFFWGLVYTTTASIAYSHGHGGQPVVPSLLVCGVIFFLCAFIPGPANRGRVYSWFNRLACSDEARAAAVLAAVVSGLPAKKAFDMAQAAFSGIRFDALSINDFKCATASLTQGTLKMGAHLTSLALRSQQAQ